MEPLSEGALAEWRAWRRDMASRSEWIVEHMEQGRPQDAVTMLWSMKTDVEARLNNAIKLSLADPAP